MESSKKEVEFFLSKDGLLNLSVNGLNYYSRYNIKSDIIRFLKPYIEKSGKRYILFGLGLGYHAEMLLEMDDKEVIIVETEANLLNLLLSKQEIIQLLKNDRITLLSKIQDLKLAREDRIIIIPTWHKTLESGPIKDALQEIIWLRTNKAANDLLVTNFRLNICSDFRNISNLKNLLARESSILVSAGPSLDAQMNFLKKAKGRMFILAVGAAYKPLLEAGIEPDAVIIEDPNPVVYAQIENIKLKIPLFVGCTVYPLVLSCPAPAKYMIFQKGMSDAEAYSREHQLDLIEVGGSVATMAFSLLLYMGVSQLIFVGQDLAYTNGRSHSDGSTSNKSFKYDIRTQYKVLSNRGNQVPTSLSWNYFRKFLENKIAQYPKVQFVNTALDGAVIRGAKYLSSNDIVIPSVTSKDYSDLIIAND
ncbi:6-hydroxymethylpterin diphosphokinase MptE-like protein [Bacillaceae bacterium CLA-AA-H227]|uniref:6-hydroxymethylpterin diphosphokinase MptE-like protein n=1 Tax=Robertmurraya yapensis (ex Hitch et al 2024) TaxID=3133160 RepID=A0ACC6SBN8_9BACI